MINTVFGVGRRAAARALPLPGPAAARARSSTCRSSVSPIVVGLALILVYGPHNGWFGKGLHNAGIQIIFAMPGMILATAFVSLPLVLRELVPVLEEEGIDQEQAARVLGANALQRFRRITLPTIRWALAYGVVLSLARSIGEFGAVKVVSGNVSGSARPRPSPLLVDERAEQFEPGAYQLAFVLIVDHGRLPSSSVSLRAARRRQPHEHRGRRHQQAVRRLRRARRRRPARRAAGS